MKLGKLKKKCTIAKTAYFFVEQTVTVHTVLCEPKKFSWENNQ